MSTPFGTDIGPSSFEAAAAFYLTRDPARAEAVLAERQVGFLLLENPVEEVAMLQGFAPAAAPLVLEKRSVAKGRSFGIYPEFLDLVPSRLFFFFDGDHRQHAAPVLDSYRLLAESDTTIEVGGLRARRFKLFGVVPGAVLHVAGVPPGEPVSASVPVTTNAGRPFAWTATAIAGESGADLRVPYATGYNGTVLAGTYQLVARTRVVPVQVPERAVLAGERVMVSLGPMDHSREGPPGTADGSRHPK